MNESENLDRYCTRVTLVSYLPVIGYNTTTTMRKLIFFFLHLDFNFKSRCSNAKTVNRSDRNTRLEDFFGATEEKIYEKPHKNIVCN
jgi:hypothetical protein